MKKLPLINSSNILVKIIGYVVYAFLILIVLGAILPAPSDDNLAEASEEDSSNANAKTLSVVVDGWNFSADLGDQWQVGSGEVEDDDLPGLNSRGEEYTDDLFIRQAKTTDDDPNWLNWQGVILSGAFILPKEGAHEWDDPLAAVEITVHKVPEEVRDWEPYDIFIDLQGEPFKTWETKDIKFNGRPAMVTEQGDREHGALDILITDDTVVSIYADTKGSGLRAWDILDKFTVTPA
jgi:hypothetical protein